MRLQSDEVCRRIPFRYGQFDTHRLRAFGKDKFSVLRRKFLLAGKQRRRHIAVRRRECDLCEVAGHRDLIADGTAGAVELYAVALFAALRRIAAEFCAAGKRPAFRCFRRCAIESAVCEEIAAIFLRLCFQRLVNDVFVALRIRDLNVPDIRVVRRTAVKVDLQLLQFCGGSELARNFRPFGLPFPLCRYFI